MLSLSPFQSTGDDILFSDGIPVAALNHHYVSVVPHGHLVGQLRVALAEREVVYGIQYVGLSHTVVTDEAVDIGRR